MGSASYSRDSDSGVRPDRTSAEPQEVQDFYEDALTVAGLESRGPFEAFGPGAVLYVSSQVSVTILARPDPAQSGGTVIEIIAVEGNLAP